MTGAKEMKICVTADAAWPFPWYFREYKNVQYPSSLPQDGGEFPVLITDWYDADKQKKAVETVGPAYEMKRYHHRVWWACDMRTILPGYKQMKTLGDVKDVLKEAQWTKIQWRKLFDLWMYRTIWADSVDSNVALGAQEMMLFVRKDLVHKFD